MAALLVLVMVSSPLPPKRWRFNSRAADVDGVATSVAVDGDVLESASHGDGVVGVSPRISASSAAATVMVSMCFAVESCHQTCQ